MRRISVFNSITLDGYFTGNDGDMDWAHSGADDKEWTDFVNGNASGDGGVFVFGRVTYEMMAGFWPTPMAIESMPTVANRMNSNPKIVFSRKMKEAKWNNTQLVTTDAVEALKKMKNETGSDILIFGSGSLIAQLTQARLIDQYQIVTVPVVIGAGRTLFEGVKDPLTLKLTKSRSFANGRVVNWYTI